MQKIPSKKSILISIFLLLVFYNIKFYLTADNNLEQSRYDFQSIQSIDSIKPIRVLLATKTLLTMVAPSNFSPTPTPTYLLENKHQRYFFRYEYRIDHQDTIELYNVHWLNGIPKNITKIKQIKWLHLDLKEQGNITAVTIGDDHICRGNAIYLRRFLNEHHHLKFLGAESDVFNYSFLGTPETDGKDVLKYAENAPQAQFYILFFNLLDKESGNLDIDNLLEINRVLKRKHPKKIFWVVPDTITSHLQQLQDTSSFLMDYPYNKNITMLPKKMYENIAKKISNQINE